MKIAFTGSHGTGKTTSVFEYAHKMKLEFPNKRTGIFHENAARAPKGLFNKNGTNLSQLWIFTNQMQNEIRLGYEYDILICDRTVFDSIAYSVYMKFDNFAEKAFQLAIEFLSTYDEIYFKRIKTNDFWFDSKHRETSDIEYRYQIEDILMGLYKRAGVLNSDKFRLL
jgi:predicted ATPase